MPADDSKRIAGDASVSAAWFFEKAGSTTAATLLGLGAVEFQVPAIWPTEMANIFISHERRGLCRPEEISHWFMLLGSMSIRIDREASTYEGAVNCVRIARQFKLSAYDAQYLELALRCHCPLASFDARLVAAAGAAGVGLGL